MDRFLRQATLLALLAPVPGVVLAGDVQNCLEAFSVQKYDIAYLACKSAAEQGSADAQYALGIMYYDGNAVQQDKWEAVSWWTRSAQQGHVDAQYNLAVFFHNDGERKNIDLAVHWYQSAALNGDVHSQLVLGDMYASGEAKVDISHLFWGGYEPRAYEASQNAYNYKEAIKWYSMAVEQGNAQAQFALGNIFVLRGRDGAEHAYDEAVKWYRQAAEQIVDVRNILGMMYENGDGVQQDYNEAVKWYREAAAQGDVQGKFNLGYMHHSGKGVTRSYERALELFQQAAEQNHASARFSLGIMHLSGEGTAADAKEAYIWFLLAESIGHKGAKKAIEIVEKNLSPDQINAAQDEAAQRAALIDKQDV